MSDVLDATGWPIVVGCRVRMEMPGQPRRYGWVKSVDEQERVTLVDDGGRTRVILATGLTVVKPTDAQRKRKEQREWIEQQASKRLSRRRGY